MHRDVDAVEAEDVPRAWEAVHRRGVESTTDWEMRPVIPTEGRMTDLAMRRHDQMDDPTRDSIEHVSHVRMRIE
jgi:hypothetical protein